VFSPFSFFSSSNLFSAFPKLVKAKEQQEKEYAERVKAGKTNKVSALMAGLHML
jgi:hypothetical protein